jgi:hypothetical protein
MRWLAGNIDFEVLFRFLERKLGKELQAGVTVVFHKKYGNTQGLKFFLLLFLSRKRREEKRGFMFKDIQPGHLILAVSILAWACAQGLKVLIVLITEGRFDKERILGGGGMPSSHSAFVCACAASIARLCGTGSPSFALATALAVIVMYDASHVRQAAGKQAKVLNYMMEHWDDKPEFFAENLKELLGHTPLQVFFGALLGLFLGWFVPMLWGY